MATLTTTQMCLGMEETFPSDGTTTDKLRFLVQYAILAPSIRNSQPWNFEVADDSIRLNLDRSRARRTTDPELRELIISCGAALEHLRVAARKFGFDLAISRFPEGKSGPLAVVKLDGAKKPTDMDTIQFYAIHKWLNVPQPLRAKKKVPDALLDELNKMANTGMTWLHLARKASSRDTLAGIVAEADEARKNIDDNRKKQLASATHSKRRRQDQTSLLQMSADGAGHIASYIQSFLRRPAGSKSEISRKQKALADSEPVLALLGTYQDTMEAWLDAGQMLAAILLRGLAVGVRGAMINQSVEMPEFREKLLAQLELRGYPQILLRFGFPEQASDARPKTAGVVAEELL